MPKPKDTAPLKPREPVAPTVSAPLEDSTPRDGRVPVPDDADRLGIFTVDAQSPNVIWRGEGEPPAFVNAGHKRVDLPDAATQRGGFYSPDAPLLVEGVVGYKRFVALADTKGGA